MTSKHEIQRFLNSNIRILDTLAEGSCYEPVRKGSRLIGLRRISCDAPGAKRTPLTLTETVLGKISVHSGHITMFSGDGRPSQHISIGEPVTLRRKQKKRVDTKGNAEAAAIIKTAREKAEVAAIVEAAYGKEAVPNEPSLTEKTQARLAAIDAIEKREGRSLLPEEIEQLDEFELLETGSRSPPAAK